MSTLPQRGISFGKALQLWPEETYMKEMDMTRRQFRSLCRALSVPLVLRGRGALIDHVQLLLALKSISRLGQQDFALPGSLPLRKGKKWRGAQNSTLDVNYVKENLTALLAELLYSRDLLGFDTQREALNYARKAAERLIMAGIAMMPAAEQEEFEQRVLHKLTQTVGPPSEDLLDASPVHRNARQVRQEDAPESRQDEGRQDLQRQA